jgi:putative transcriptional regulator
MISCREFAVLLIDYVDNQLSTEQWLSIEEHLETCPPCKTFLATYRLTINVTHKLAERPLPAELVQRLRVALAPYLAGRECAPPPP